MASRKKPSEGIALLSMYNDDEEDDEEMEEANDSPSRELQQEPLEPNEGRERNDAEPDLVVKDAVMLTDEFSDKASSPVVAGQSNSTPKYASVLFSSPPPQRQQVAELETRRRSGGGRFSIVDYGHDEVAMSPEPGEREFDEVGQTGDLPEKISPDGGQVSTAVTQATSQSSEHVQPSQQDEINNTSNEAEAVENDAKDTEGNVDPLDKFLPQPPKEPCPEELQKKINKFLALKKVGRSFNAEVRNRKDYRNPDFLLHAVRYQDIDQIGSCFSKDVFDPHGYDPRDYYLEIEADMRHERERKEQELKKSPKVDFVAGGTQPGVVLPSSKFSMPIPVAAPSVMHSASTVADVVPREGRQNKKSKWDKVDSDGRNTLLVGGQDAIHVATLSSANVGAGYLAYAQQKRREAEEKRSSERKLDRRS